jgi:hypothetical protein
MKYPLSKYPRLGQYPHEATKTELVSYIGDLTDYLQACLTELRERLAILSRREFGSHNFEAGEFYTIKENLNE